MKYYIDANILIQGYKAFYPMDVFVSYWPVLERLINNGTFVIIDKVWDEVQDEELKDWLNAHVGRNVVERSDIAINEYQQVLRWAYNRNFKQEAITLFADNKIADAFIVAQAKHEDAAVITYEVPEPNRTSRVKVPDACNAMGVRWMNLVDAFRELNITI